MRSIRVVLSFSVLSVLVLPAAAVAEPLLERVEARAALPEVRWSARAMRAARGGPKIRVRDFPLTAERAVDLELEPFEVTRPDTRFVLGRKDAPDEELAIDPAQVGLFRGRVVGRPGSHVFLALADGATTGYVDLGDGSTRFQLAARDAHGAPLPSGRAVVYRADAAPALPPEVPFCGTDTAQLGDAAASASAPPLAPLTLSLPAVGAKHLELAVETDYEYFQLFDDLGAASAYLIALYAQVSDIYLRDQDVRVDLVFVRLWDDANDLFNEVDPSPLSDFRDHWNANMGAVQRDVAQLLSGRRDYPFGGQAYLSSLCGSNAYSVVGYAIGSFPDPSKPSPLHYDISVSAHEIGHNAGTGHTHDSPNFVDTCDDPLSTPQRGSIMSYCGQTWSGGNGNRDLYFHATIQQNIDAHVAASSCVVDDCNGNGVADATDIAGGEPDTNGNGIPDVCEDCNGNLVLDPDDIALGNSTDLNSDGIPDDCQPDCNGNSVPDDRDIALGTSTDAYGNDIPDECETDCDSDGTSDYTEIQLDMTLDIDRNAELDACQDCDGDLVPDLTQLDRSHDLWLASGLAASPLRGFYASSGVLTAQTAGGAALIEEAQDLLIVPGDRVLVSSADDDRVAEFDRNGNYLGDLVTAGSGGLDHPAGLLWLPDGRLLVASHLGDSVLAFDGLTGAPLGAFVTAGQGGLNGPFGLALGPNGNLFVTSETHEVIEYDGATGALVGTFVSAAANGGLDTPRGLLFKPDGDLLVTSFGNDQTLAYHGDTGFPLGRWALSGTATRLTQESPWGLRIGPNGNVFIVRTGEAFGSSGGGGHGHGDDHGALHLTNAQMYEFDVRNGNFIRAHINGNDHGMEFPTGFDFVPGWSLDCNQNRSLDSCDISSGASADLDTSGVPDECELDCNQNGVLDRLDLIPIGAEYDCNGNLVPDSCDTAAGTGGACEFAFEQTCDDGEDNDRDGFVDCFDADCDPSALCPGKVLLAADFDATAEGFLYQDDTFRGTSEPAYASGFHDTAEGLRGSGGLRVDLGGIDGADIFDMSGGWVRSISIPANADVQVGIRFELAQEPGYEPDEFSQAIASFDGVAFGPAPDDFLAQMDGDGQGGVGEVRTTGWIVTEHGLGSVAAGSYDLVVGGYNNKKTLADESTAIRVDAVALTHDDGSADCANGIDDDGDGRIDVGDDPGCDSAADASEWDAALPCDDGVDQDGDGLRDFPADPGCGAPEAMLEDPQCSDGIDNDSDGGVDWDGAGTGTPDPQCNGLPYLNRERPKPPCGLGFELAPVLVLLSLATRRRQRRSTR